MKLTLSWFTYVRSLVIERRATWEEGVSSESAVHGGVEDGSGQVGRSRSGAMRQPDDLTFRSRP